MTRVRSFDVFDTVLTRAVGSPVALLFLVGRAARREGLIECPAETFLEARLEAERRVYLAARERGDQVRIADVYVELRGALELSAAQAESVQRLELALEDRVLGPVPGARAWVAEERARAERVAFVSDTPLPEAFLAEQLRRHGMLEETGDLLLVSSECGSNKADGAIYSELARRAAVPEGEILHHGNHLRNDVEAAERAGLAARARPEGNLNRFEESLDRDAPRTAGLSAAFAGASRLARLGVDACTPAHRALRDVAAGVTGPLLAGYVIWLLREARRRGLTTLWFLARDGQVLLELAELLAPKLGVEVELRYLLASRQAWNLPAFARGAHGDLAWMWDHTHGLSARILLARAGVTPEEVAGELQELGLQKREWSRPLRRGELAGLRGLAESETFRARVRAVAEEREPLLRRYLDQEGVTAAGNAAVVELAGHGNLQESLTAVLMAAGGEAPLGFYFGVMSDGRERSMGAMLSYLDPESSAGLVPGFAVIALEAFCAADHGTLVGFEERGGRAVPILRPDNGPVTAWGLDLLRRTVVEFAHQLVLDEDLVDPGADVRGSVTAVLESFWRCPSRAEAAAWGSFPWEDGFGAETRYLPLARAYSWRDVARALRRHRIVPQHRAEWQAGALALTPRLRRRALRAAVRVSRALELRASR